MLNSVAEEAGFTGFLLLPHLASRLIVGSSCNATGASVLMAGLFHAKHNARAETQREHPRHWRTQSSTKAETRPCGDREATRSG